MLENAKIAAQRAALLRRQMLAYAGKGRFVVEHVDLPALVHSTCELIRASIPKTIHLNIQAPRQSAPIESDSSQIQQVIMNLILNAAEAIGEENADAITVRIDTLETGGSDGDATPRPGRYAMLEVNDTGSGMTEDTRATIFEPFFTTKFTGRGLGLAAVMGIVRSANGSIDVRSTLGKGTTFSCVVSHKQLRSRGRTDSGCQPSPNRDRRRSHCG
jgi:signal transduction histidine kinase